MRAAIVPFFGPMTAFKAFFAVIVPPFGPMTATLGGEAVVKRMLLMPMPVRMRPMPLLFPVRILLMLSPA